jgi:hypothetical protein
VHERLAARARTPGLPAAELLGLGVYHHCAHQALGHAPDAEVAQRLLAQLAAQLGAQPPGAWLAPHFDYACGAAWLHRHLAADAQADQPITPQLAILDQQLAQLAQAEKQLSRQRLVRLVRYFDLRGPAPVASPTLAHLLGPAGLAGAEAPAKLGLAGGLAAELLLLMRLAQGPAPHPSLSRHVREGVQRLLALKQAVDFQGQHYNLFPDYVQAPAQEPIFGCTLSWSQGDIGQALVLYGASALFADDELRRIADLVGLNTLLRTSAAATGIASAQFGHGAAGVAHLYERLHRASGGLPKYEQGYQFWLGETQRWLAQELATGPGGPHPGDLPTGLAGVGLVLLAHATGTRPTWDSIWA